MSGQRAQGQSRGGFFIFKPDGIGDFVLATGAVRLLEKEADGGLLVLCVLKEVEPLARAQFPEARIITLPLLKKRRVLNLFLANLLRCAGPWKDIRRYQLESAVCLKHLRAYLFTLLFYSARCGTFFACENNLAQSGGRARRFVEWLARIFRRPRLLPYPQNRDSTPLELEANRRVVSAALGREITLAEIAPRLTATPPPRSAPYWLCCPFSSMRSKDYPPGAWAEVFRQLQPLPPTLEVHLGGGPDQRDALESFHDKLSAAGVSRTSILPALPLQEFTNHIAGAELVLTVDTAAAHIATALDRPAIILFSGLHRGVFAPWQSSPNQCWLEPTPGTPRKKWHEGIPVEFIAARIRVLTGTAPA